MRVRKYEVKGEFGAVRRHSSNIVLEESMSREHDVPALNVEHDETRLTRRRFNATIAAGAVSAFGPLGSAAMAAQAPSPPAEELCEMNASELAARSRASRYPRAR